MEAVVMECWDCGRREEFEDIEEAVREGWGRLRVGGKTGRHGRPRDGEGYDLCPEDANSTRFLELVTERWSS